MSVPRYSLRALLIGMAAIAVVATALVSGTSLWADAIFNLAIGIILVTTLAAIFSGGASRTFCRGFCLIAWIYMALVFGPGLSSTFRQHLVTEHMLMSLQRRLAPIHAARYVQSGFVLQQTSEGRYQTGPRSGFDVWGGSWQATQRTGHSTWAMLLGLVGGYLAMTFSRRSRNDLSAG